MHQRFYHIEKYHDHFIVEMKNEKGRIITWFDFKSFEEAINFIKFLKSQ